MPKNVYFTLTLFLCTLLFTACDETETLPNTFNIAKSSLAKEENPKVSNQALQNLSQANNLFTFDIYSHLYTPTTNIVFSGYSLFNLLNILSAGAHATTKEQLLQVLHLQEESHQAFNALNTTLTKSTNGFHIESTNALWMQEGFDIKTPFLETLAREYDAAVYLLDFQANPKKSTDIINSWIAKKTEDIITQLIPDNALDAQTKLVLTNTLYLKGDWVHKFPQQRTLYKNFTLLDGTSTQVQTMHQENSFGYLEINGTQILSMAYHDSDYALLSIMPPRSAFSDFKQEDFSIMIENLKPTLLNLYYPRYSFSTKSNLVTALQQAGMKDAFTQDADFSCISDQSLFISQVIQQTHITVDENGTEAAAATALSIATTSLPTETPLEVKFDHPFLFALYHIPTQTILFYGQMLNPSNQ